MEVRDIEVRDIEVKDIEVKVIEVREKSITDITMNIEIEVNGVTIGDPVGGI